ncbi:MAG TPA: hypothetical protein VFP21_09985 [Solirubrobacterales bacterium]|nr:hypothetical protein [Solirubrobacterales bacterium]
MHKKLMLACMAIASMAAFVASGASASPLLTNSGVAVPVGTSITGKNTGNIVFTGAFNVTCPSLDLNGTVTENNGVRIKGEIPVGAFSITGTGAGGDCTSALGSVKVTVNSKVCLETNKGTDNLVFTGCGGAPYTATFEITGTGPCKYSVASVTATYLTNTGATVNVFEQATKKEEGGIFCPTEGKADDDLDLYATGGTPQLTIS